MSRHLRPGHSRNNCTDQHNMITCALWQTVKEVVERCSPHLEEACEESSPFTSACHLYQLPVARKEGRLTKVYKNPHCALCASRRNTSGLGCYTGRSQHHRPSCHFIVPPSLSLLLDFSGGQAVGSRCREDQFYDGLHQACFNIKCGSLYSYNGSRCEAGDGGQCSQVCQEKCTRRGWAGGPQGLLHPALGEVAGIIPHPPPILGG